MPTPVTNGLSLTASPTGTTAPSASTDPLASLFGAVLTAAQGGTPEGTRVTLAGAAAGPEGRSLFEAPAGETPPGADLLAAVLLQLGVTLTPTQPTPAPEGTEATPAAPTAEGVSRTEQLRFRVAAAVTQTTQATPPTAELAEAEPEVRAATTATPTESVAPTSPQAATPTLPAADPAAVPVAARVPTIPAQVPIVTDAVRVAPSPIPFTEATPAPVVAPTAPDPVAALPGVVVGDRPSTTGERIAADVVAATRVAQPTALAPTGEFATTLRTAAEAPAAVLPAPAPDNGPLTPTAPVVVAPPQFPVTVEVIRPEPEVAEPVAPSVEATPVVVPPSAPAPAAEVAAPKAAEAVRATPAVQVADAVVAHVRAGGRDGTTEFQLRLDPPELGRVRVHLVTDGEAVTGRVLVADQAVRQVIETQLPELRQRLEEAGVSVQRFDVGVDADGGRGAPRRDVPEYDGPTAPARPRPAPSRAPRGELDVTV